MVRRSVPAGTTLREEGEAGDTLYILVSGTAEIYVQRPPLADIILAICGPGEILGELHAVDDRSRSATVTKLKPCVLYPFVALEFLSLLSKSPQLSMNLTLNVLQRLRLSSIRLETLAHNDGQRRVAGHLLLFAERYRNAATAPDGYAPKNHQTQQSLPCQILFLIFLRFSLW